MSVRGSAAPRIQMALIVLYYPRDRHSETVHRRNASSFPVLDGGAGPGGAGRAGAKRGEARYGRATPPKRAVPSYVLLRQNKRRQLTIWSVAPHTSDRLWEKMQMREQAAIVSAFRSRLECGGAGCGWSHDFSGVWSEVNPKHTRHKG